MTHLPRVALEIKTVGLYDLVLQDVQKILGKNRVSEEEILQVMQEHPEIFEDYKQINVEYNLSNIHLRNIDLDTIKDPEAKELAKKVNENLDHLREIEKYTLDFEQSSTLVIIFSIEFFVLFSVQYFIVLLDLKEWQWWIYSFFALSIVVAWIYAKKERKVYDTNNAIYEKKYEETLQMIQRDEYQNFMLDEGSSGTSKGQMKLIKMSTDVFAIGDWMPYTEELELFHNRWSTSEATNQMSDMSAMVIDGFYRDLYYYGAGHMYDISAEADGVNNVIDPAFGTASKKLVTALKLSGAMEMSSILSSSPNYGTVPVNGKFVAYGHVAAIDAMEDGNADWVPIEKYADRVTLLPNERGMLKNIRYVEDADGYIVPTGVAGEYIAEFVVGGKDHTAQVPLRGKGKLETVYNQIGSGGTSDPLSRVGSLGWKGWLGAKVLYPERLGILKAKFNY
jgi:N4-gp56 family major capsid protein